ncbi:hypothetical protein LCGC14_1101700 [marine sediment metagenome]|uniref:Uncharacterized protein n=1 Tax=marine sediment metagenome TaxID=412755 RepID=A0A0F9QFG2_9ZZZZ
MPIKITCPVCKSQLLKMTKKHIGSKKHTDALRNAKIHASRDPALDLIKKVQKKPSKKNNFDQIIYRLSNLEKIVYQLQKQQEQISNYINLKREVIKNKKIKDIKPKEILGAINRCVKSNQNQSRWVKINDVISLLKLYREQDLNGLNKILISMFNKNLIDLAEGGDPKYPVIYQNRIYGMVAHQ